MGYSAKLSWLGIAAMGCIAVLVATRWGIGISPDSVTYIGGARNLAEGRGFSMPAVSGSAEPITQYPPFYSFVLAVFRFFGPDPLVSSRWINAVIFAANIFLVCALASSCLTQNHRASRLLMPIMAGWWLMSSNNQVEIHSMAWTESLFILLSFAGVYLLAKYFLESSQRSLIISGLLMALAVLTRYAGIVLVITGGLAILFFGTKPLTKKISDSLVFGGLSILPLSIWLVRNLTVAGNATSREVIFHPIGRVQVQQALDTMSSWFLIQSTASGWIKLSTILLVFLIIAVGLIGAIRRQKEVPIIVLTIILFVIAYFAFLVLSISFIDANTPLDSRILSPLYYCVIILLIFAIGQILEFFPENIWLVRIAIAMIVVLSIGFLIKSERFICLGYRNGLGFNSVSWRQSEMLAHVATLPQGIPIYSNAPEAIYIYTNRPSDRLPAKFQSANHQINTNYQTDLDRMGHVIDANQGVVVYFTTVQHDLLPTSQELIQELQLHQDFATSDGIVLAGP